MIYDVFDYHLGLHYSQTMRHPHATVSEFDYHLGLHYSQTSKFQKCVNIRILTMVWSSTPTLQQSIRRQQNDYSTESKTRKGLCR